MRLHKTCSLIWDLHRPHKNMSKATKRKHVVKEVLDEYVLPDDSQEIVRVSAGRGNNLHEVENGNGEKYLVSMPTKFRKNIWIKRGDFLIVQKIDEGDKVKAEIAYILYREQIKYIKDHSRWPARFAEEASDKNCNSVIPDDMLPPSDSDSENEHLGEQVINTNRPTVAYDDESSEENEEDIQEIG